MLILFCTKRRFQSCVRLALGRLLNWWGTTHFLFLFHGVALELDCFETGIRGHTYEYSMETAEKFSYPSLTIMDHSGTGSGVWLAPQSDFLTSAQRKATASVFTLYFLTSILPGYATLWFNLHVVVIEALSPTVDLTVKWLLHHDTMYRSRRQVWTLQ